MGGGARLVEGGARLVGGGARLVGGGARLHFQENRGASLAVCE